MPLLEAWNATFSGRVPSYPAGTWGPDEAKELMDEKWRIWAEL
jgi:glucose-6-phosphate 1-dehydrogenase